METKQNDNFIVKYGKDDVFGLFIQVTDKREYNGNIVGLIVDLNQENCPELTIEDIVKVAEEYDIDISYEIDSVIQIGETSSCCDAQVVNGRCQDCKDNI